MAQLCHGIRPKGHGVGHHGTRAVARGQGAGGGGDLGRADIGLGKERLAVQVR